jgi:hypothetical protein
MFEGILPTGKFRDWYGNCDSAIKVVYSYYVVTPAW